MNQDTLTLENVLRFLRCYPGCLFLKDAQGRYLYSSEICEHLNRFEDGSTLIGKTELEVQSDPQLARQYYEEDQRLLREGGSVRVVSEFKGPLGSSFFEINKAAVTDESGAVIGIIGSVDDVTKEREVLQELHRQYTTDPVTGVRNGKFLEEWLAGGEPSSRPFTLISADCNFLKHINDTHGHEYGDKLLRHAGELFREVLPAGCTPVRTGGDEFLILCENTSCDEALQLVERLRQAMRSRNVKGSQLSLAFGTCTMTDAGMGFDECRAAADADMYADKRRMKKEYLSGEGKNDPICNEEMFRRLISQMPVIAFFKDTDCRYRYISEYDERDLRSPKETNYGIGLTDLELQKDPEMGRRYYEDDLELLRTGKGTVIDVTISDEGGDRYFHIAKAPVWDDTGELLGIAGIVADITGATDGAGITV